MSVMRVIVLHPYTKFEVRRLVKIWLIFFTALIGLGTLTCDLLTAKRGHGSTVS